MHTIQDIIKTLRTPPLGLSQTEIARQTGIHQTKISRWAAGSIPAGADDALKLQSLLRTMQTPTNNAQPATESEVTLHDAHHEASAAGGLAVCQLAGQGA